MKAGQEGQLGQGCQRDLVQCLGHTVSEKDLRGRWGPCAQPGCTELMAVAQDRREGQRGARKHGRPHALRPLCPPAPERGQEGWPPACAEASVSTSRPGCRMQSGLHPHRHRGPRRLDTPRGRRRVLLRDGSKWGPGPGRVLAMLGSLRRAFSGSWVIEGRCLVSWGPC